MIAMTRLILLLILSPAFGVTSASSQPIEIGSRRELFVDRFVIDTMDRAELKLHRPVKSPRPRSPLPERHYVTVIKDGDLYRAYWRGADPGYT